MSVFKLKAGSHVTGTGNKMKTANANDPKNCFVESKYDLATLDPARFEAYTGEKPRSLMSGKERAEAGEEEMPPPAPPVPTQLPYTPRTAEEKKAKAEELRAQAEALDAEAEEGDEGGTDIEAAVEHQHTLLAKSDSGDKARKAYEEGAKARKEAAAETEDEEETEEDEDDLSSMSVQELRQEANRKGINIHGLSKKTDLIKAIKEGKEED